MAIQTYNTSPARNSRLTGEILAHAVKTEVLGITGSQHQMPRNKGTTIVFRRWLPYGGVDNRLVTSDNVDTIVDAHRTQEGVTPTADTLSAVDIPVTLQEFACVMALTNQTAELHEDGVEITDEMKSQVGERIGLVREMTRYGVLKGMTNVFYGGAGVSQATVNGSVTIDLLRKIAKTLNANHAKRVTSILAPSANFGTTPVEASYLVFCSTDLEPAIRDLPGFTPTSAYGQRKVVHEMELGSCESFRFIVSPELVGKPDAGAAVGSTRLQSTGGVKVDIYPLIVVGQNAWGQVALRGQNALEVTHIPVGQKDKSDPLGQRGFVGARTWFAAEILNDGWAAVAWVGTPDLSA